MNVTTALIEAVFVDNTSDAYKLHQLIKIRKAGFAISPFLFLLPPWALQHLSSNTMLTIYAIRLHFIVYAINSFVYK